MSKTKTSVLKKTDRLMIDAAYGPEYLPGCRPEDAFTWYRYTCEEAHAKKFLLEYFLFIEDQQSYNIYSKVDAKLIYGYASTSCWVARMLTIGFILDKKYMDWFHNYLKIVLEKQAAHEEEKRVVIPRPSYNPLASKILNNYYLALNEILDAINIQRPKIKDASISVDGTLKKYSVHKNYKKEFISELKECLNELDICIAKSDMEMLQSYTRAGYTNLMLKRKRDFISNVIYYAETYFDKISSKQKIVDKVDIATGVVEQVVMTVEKKPRKPRKKKVVSPDKRISRLKYMKAFPELKLVSVDPRKMLGAKEVWLYNTRYGQLQVYRSTGEGGLDLRGSVLLNFDADKSATKRIGRYVDTIIPSVLTGGKVALRRTMDEIKSAATECSGRIGENTIILRVI